MNEYYNRDRTITLDRLPSFLSGRRVLDKAYMKPEFCEGHKKEMSKVGVLASTIAKFAATTDYDEALEIGLDLASLCKNNNMEFPEDGSYILDTDFGKIKFFRLADQNFKDGLARMFFETQTNKPFNNVIRIVARQKNVEYFDHVAGLTDIYHWTEDGTGGYLSSWIETDFGKSDSTKTYVIDPKLRIAMPKRDYYFLFMSSVISRIKGEVIAEDCKNPMIKRAILQEKNYEYIFCRDELVKKLTGDQLGE